jgi:hypothetical protein
MKARQIGFKFNAQSPRDRSQIAAKSLYDRCTMLPIRCESTA